MAPALDFRANLPKVRGPLTLDAPLRNLSWFRTGGPAEVLFEPSDEADLAAFLAQTPVEVPLTVLGLGSNLLIRDGGVPGVVVRLGASFQATTVNDTILGAGAGTPDAVVARTAEKAGLDGFAFLSGIPGTIGGALRMNAGSYGSEIKDIFMVARALDRKGIAHDLEASAMGFAYRCTKAPDDYIFVGALFKGLKADPQAIHEKMEAVRKSRGEAQPLGSRTGGSTFANPEDDPKGRKAWELIDAAGCRGLVRGDAVVSEKHCNFLINRGAATAADIEGLGEEVRSRVKDMFGIDLRWEIRRIGIPLPPR